MVSYFHENLSKRIGAVAQTVYTDVYNCLRHTPGFFWFVKKTEGVFLGCKNGLRDFLGYAKIVFIFWVDKF